MPPVVSLTLVTTGEGSLANSGSMRWEQADAAVGSNWGHHVGLGRDRMAPRAARPWKGRECTFIGGCVQVMGPGGFVFLYAFFNFSGLWWKHTAS